jgi:hypothetical protein
MTAKQRGSIYLVDANFFSPALLLNYRATLSASGRRRKVGKVKVLGLVAGSRSYECQVVDIADKVRLSTREALARDSRARVSSKSLVNVDAPASRQRGPQSPSTSSDDL